MDYILNNIKNTTVQMNPFPHLVIDNFLDNETYEEIKKDINNITFFDKDDNMNNRSTKMICSNNLLRKEESFKKYFDILSNKNLQDLVLKKLNPKKYKGYYKSISIQIDCFRNEFKYPIHTDGSSKYMTFVLYVPINNDNKELGTKVYDKKKNLVKSVEYIPNRCFIFSPSTKSFHNMYADNCKKERHSIQSWYFMKKSQLVKYIDRKGINNG
jgi:hypothetical protein